jgi:hypothetical protein
VTHTFDTAHYLTPYNLVRVIYSFPCIRVSHHGRRFLSWQCLHISASSGVEILRRLDGDEMTTRELAQDVQDAVEQDYTLHYRVTDAEQFLDRLLPVQKATCGKMLQYMKEKASTMPTLSGGEVTQTK